MAAPVLRVTIVGLTDLRARLAQASGDGLTSIWRALTTQYGTEIRDIYREEAPRSLQAFGTQRETKAFWQGIGYRSASLVTTMELRIQVADAQLAQWLREGTGIYGPKQHRIVPTTAKALAFDYQGRHIVVRSVKGMKPNNWEERAQALAEPLIEEFATAVGNLLAEEIAGGV